MTTTPKPYTLNQMIIMCVLTVVIFVAGTLLLAGDWLWIEGWLFGLWMSAMILSTMIYTYRNDPALLAERARASSSDNQKTWDKYLLSAIYLIAILWLIIMPLDAKRFAWSPSFPVWLKVLGGVALLPALYFIFRSTVENTFLSTRVRIQTDRKQRVISTGVYGFVRHPLYLGCALLMFGAPLLLGSIVGLIISVIAFIILIARIMGEEKMLINELEGYTEYQHTVKYRLIPFVW
jgi:protein-S-isoprenylcysteine O-methyltransferase Ste14